MSARLSQYDPVVKQGARCSLACGIIASLALLLLMFVLDWSRWWLFAVFVIAIIGFAMSVDVRHSLTGGFSLAINCVCLGTTVVYGIICLNASSEEKTEHRTILVCGTDTRFDDDGNTEWIIRTPSGSYNIEAGTYHVLENDKLRKTYAVSAGRAANLLAAGSAFDVTVTVTRFGGDLDSITAAKQVPNKLGSCSD